MEHEEPVAQDDGFLPDEDLTAENLEDLDDDYDVEETVHDYSYDSDPLEDYDDEELEDTGPINVVRGTE